MLATSNTHFRPPFPVALLTNDASSVSFKFQPGKTYKIKIISIAAFASTFLQFDSHTMRVIEVDGSYIEKHDAYQIRVAPAQRYTVLLNAQPTTRRNYAFLASLDMNRDFNDPNAQPPNAYPFNITGTLIYDTAKPLPAPYVVRSWNPVNDFTFAALDGERLLGTPNVDITLNFTFGFDAKGIPRWVLSMKEPQLRDADQIAGLFSIIKPTSHRKFLPSSRHSPQEQKIRTR